MAFSTLTCAMIPVLSAVSDIPDDLALHYADECFYFRVPLAESDDGRWLVTIDVGYQEYRELAPCADIGPIEFFAFGYEITLFDQIDGVSYSTFNPREARPAIPDEMRPLVIEVACHCFIKLLPTCCPDYIFRTTWLPNPSENALKKHLRANEILAQADYIVLRHGTDQRGCKYWLLGKSDSDHSHLDPSGLVSSRWEQNDEPSYTL